MKKLVFLSLLVLLISACVSRESVFSTLKGNSGLIAYLGIDGNVYVSDEGGDNQSQLTRDAKNQTNDFVAYQLPTWSQDGNQLAFIRSSGTTVTSSSNIMVANVSNNDVSEIYTSEMEHPFYMLWSPDDTHVTFLSTSATQGLLLLQSVSVDGNEHSIIDTGSPYYWSWAPDGRALITHSGGADASTTPEHLAFLQMQDSNVVEDDLDVNPGSFQAPVWSPDGNHIAIPRTEDGKNEIILTDGHGEFESVVGNFSNYTAVGWSGNATKLAYIDGDITSLNAGVIGKLNVVDIDTMQTTTAESDSVLAFFWSPSGRELVYFVPVLAAGSGSSSATSQQLYLQTFILNAETGESRELFTFQPTQQFVSILPYFDQYHQSNTIWSPDSQNIVLSFIGQDDNPGIAVIDVTTAELSTKLLANGVLAFWSWK